MAQTLRPPKAPNLPIGPVEYSQDHQNQLAKIQRLYFNEIDNTLSSVLENSGGRFLNFPHIFASNSARQFATGDNTPTIVAFDTVARAEGFTLNVDETATATYSGAYRVDYRMLFENGDATQHNVWIWLQKNGSDVANSCSKSSVAAGGYIDVIGSIELDLDGGSDLALYWATDKYTATAGGTGVWMDAYTNSTSPFTRPAIPSVYGSITFVSELSQ